MKNLDAEVESRLAAELEAEVEGNRDYIKTIDPASGLPTYNYTWPENYEDSPAVDPETRKALLEKMIATIDELKGTTHYHVIVQLLAPSLMQFAGDDEELRRMVLNDLQAYADAEQQELAQNPDVNLADLPHAGADALKSAFDRLTDDEIKAAVEIISEWYRRPNDVYYVIHKMTQPLFSADAETREALAAGLDVKVSRRGKKPVVIPMQAYMIAGEEVLPPSLIPYDKVVFNAVCTIFKNGYRGFTLNQIFFLITGRNPSQTNDDKLQLRRIEDSLRRMMGTLCNFDATEEYKLHNIPFDDDTPPRAEGNVLGLFKTDNLVICGQKTAGYVFTMIPPVLYHAETIGQIMKFDRAALTVDVNMTETNQLLMHYMWERILLMRNEKNTMSSPKILYDTMFDKCGLSQTKNGKPINRTRKKELREYATKILAFWVKNDYIAGYAETKQGQKVTGVVVAFKPASRKCDQSARNKMNSKAKAGAINNAIMRFCTGDWNEDTKNQQEQNLDALLMREGKMQATYKTTAGEIRVSLDFGKDDAEQNEIRIEALRPA